MVAIGPEALCYFQGMNKSEPLYIQSLLQVGEFSTQIQN